MNAPLPIPEDLQVEEPNPYRRRQKVIGVRRGASGKARKAWRAAAALVLALAAGFSGFLLCRRIFYSGLFSVQSQRDVVITGGHIVAPGDVLSAIGFDVESPSLFRVDPARAQRQVDAIPWVESSSVERIFPGGLRIALTERTPVAYAEVGGVIELVDREGVLLPIIRKSRLDFPVLYGLDGADNPAARKAMMARYEDFFAAVRGEIGGWSLSEVDLSDPEDLRALLVQSRSTILVHFGSDDYAARMKMFENIAPQALAANPRIDSMDMRYPGEVVVDPADPAPASHPAGVVSKVGQQASPAKAPRKRAHRVPRRRRARRG